MDSLLGGLIILALNKLSVNSDVFTEDYFKKNIEDFLTFSLYKNIKIVVKIVNINKYYLVNVDVTAISPLTFAKVTANLEDFTIKKNVKKHKAATMEQLPLPEAYKLTKDNLLKKPKIYEATEPQTLSLKNSPKIYEVIEPQPTPTDHLDNNILYKAPPSSPVYSSNVAELIKLPDLININDNSQNKQRVKQNFNSEENKLNQSVFDIIFNYQPELFTPKQNFNETKRQEYSAKYKHIYFPGNLPDNDYENFVCYWLMFEHLLTNVYSNNKMGYANYIMEIIS